jgi:ABC-type multidrug transport system permease subunit
MMAGASSGVALRIVIIAMMFVALSQFAIPDALRAPGFSYHDLHFLTFRNQPCGLFFSTSLSLRESALRSLLQHFLIPFGNQPCGLFFSISLSPQKSALWYVLHSSYPFGNQLAVRNSQIYRLTVLWAPDRKQPPLNILLHHFLSGL